MLNRLYSAESEAGMLINSPFQVEVTEWISSKHNMGMVVTREQWSRISACATQFCQVETCYVNIFTT